MSEKEVLDLLENLSTQLRGDLTNLYNGLHTFAPKAQRQQDEKLDANAAVMDKSYYRLFRLVENLSDSKYLASSRPLSLQSVDMVKFIGDIGEKCNSAVYDTGKTVTFHCPTATLIWRVDKEAMERLVYHLISNALKYCEGSVALRLSQKDQHLQFQVQDQGCGMHAQQIRQALTLQKPQAVYHDTKLGLGLGLPIAHAIAKHHGGTLGIESQVGQGTTVTVTLPQGEATRVGLADVPSQYDTRSGFNPTLIYLADTLPAQAFTICKQD